MKQRGIWQCTTTMDIFAKEVEGKKSNFKKKRWKSLNHSSSPTFILLFIKIHGNYKKNEAFQKRILSYLFINYIKAPFG